MHNSLCNRIGCLGVSLRQQRDKSISVIYEQEIRPSKSRADSSSDLSYPWLTLIPRRSVRSNVKEDDRTG
jgi:hypothetical protein